MKKILYAFAALPLLIMLSCMNESAETGMNRGTFTLSYSVLDQGSESKTRATVPSVDGEETVNSLWLLFFEYSEDGSGKFVAPYEVTGQLGMNAKINIPFSGATELKNDKDYRILAMANIDRSDYLSSDPLTWINSNFTGHTEYYAIMNAMAYLSGAPGNDEQDDSGAILPSEIFMSGTTTKYANVHEVELELTRGVARFDVQNLCREDFDIVSVSIWNAAVLTPVWTGENYDTPGRTQRFYGLKRTREEDDDDPLPDFKGGLYTFENFVSAPSSDDKVTTCLIIGVAPRETAPASFTKGVTYHRVNVHPEDGGQNLKRNNVYKVSISSIVGEGADDEYEAWSKGVNNLDLIINNWNLDDNGLILTDGRNTLVIPVKRVVLNPEGDEREYSIYYLGDGQPYISKTDMPNGLTATLVNGNRLVVTADPLTETVSERVGMIEITLNALKGEINFIQSPVVSEFLKLNKTDVPSFSAIGFNEIPDGPIEITSSGPWTAKIYNNDTGSSNPGFAFNLTSGGETPQVTRTYADNYESNYLQIFTTGANPTSNPRYSFVTITLDSNPEVTRSLVLIQKGMMDLSLSPDLSSITFYPTGDAPANYSNVDSDGYIYFLVNPGIDDGTNLPNNWMASLSDGSYMDLKVENNVNHGSEKQIVRVKAAGKNLLGKTINDVLTVSYTDGSSPVSVRISQAALGMKLVAQGSTEVSVKGGLFAGMRVEADESLTWSAYIEYVDTQLAHGHQGWLVGPNGEKITGAGQFISGRPVSELVRVGFPKVLTPNVDVNPKITIRVELDNTPLFETFTVTQEELTTKKIEAVSQTTGYRGWISNSNSSNYNIFYNRAIQNMNLFSGVMYVPSFNVAKQNWGSKSTETIPSTYNHFNAQAVGAMDAASSQKIMEWLGAYEGVLVINDDYYAPGALSGFANGKLYQLLGYTSAYYTGNPPHAGEAHRPRKNNDSRYTGTKVYKYIYGGDGPFGAANPTTIFAGDAERNTLATFPDSAVPIVVDGNGYAVILIDPANRVVFNGELQIMQETPGMDIGWNGSSPSNDLQRFLANYVAYIHNVAMYGTHFTDHFLPETNTTPPYDYKR